jgi:hypothetical protein
MQCLYEISWASRWYFQQSTFRQQVGSFPIGRGGGRSWNLAEGDGVVNVGEGGVGKVSVTGVDSLGGGDVAVAERVALKKHS